MVYEHDRRALRVAIMQFVRKNRGCYKREMLNENVQKVLTDHFKDHSTDLVMTRELAFLKRIGALENIGLGWAVMKAYL